MVTPELPSKDIIINKKFKLVLFNKLLLKHKNAVLIILMKYDTFLGILIEFLAGKPLISFPQKLLFTNYTGQCTNF